MKIENKYFPNTGYISMHFNEDELHPIKSEIFEIQKNNFSAVEANNLLAGNIEKEYKLLKCKDYVQNLIIPICAEYDKEFNLMKSLNILTKDCPLVLDSLWVNFQSKGEFNPSHNHSGVFSFVIWIDIPYDIEIEKSRPSSKNSNSNCPGHFEFAYTNSLGRVSNYRIPTDKKFMNRGVFFPANFVHSVYPFFTSDDYRISVSGNFKLQV